MPIPFPQIPTALGVGLLTLALLAAPSTSGASSNGVLTERYEYHHFKESQQLALDPTRLYLFVDGAMTSHDRDACLAAHDLSISAADPRERNDLLRASVPPGRRSDAGVRELMNELVDEAGVRFVSPVFFDEVGGTTAITQDVFVRFVDGVSNAEGAAILATELPGTILDIDHWGQPGLFHVRSSDSDGFKVLDRANALAIRADVEFAEPDRIMTIFPADVTPSDPWYGVSWAVHNTGQWVDGWVGVADIDMNGPQAWDHTIGSANIVVAILDNGVQQNHPDLNQVTPGIDTTLFSGNDGGPLFVGDNHGTPVAGCIASIMNNGIGTVGMAPGCRVLSVKIAYDANPEVEGWTTQSSWVADGVFAAENAGASITNSSFHMGSSSVITIAYSATLSLGVMHFAAAGNGGDDGIGDPSLDYPASLGTTNAIAAITPTGVLTGFSNYGSGLHFAAPGTSVYTTDRTGNDGYSGGSYTYFGGTSAASPCAAAVAALVRSANPSLTPAEVGTIMASTTKDLGAAGYDTTFGYGIPRGEGALVLALFGGDCPGSGSCATSNGTPGCSNAGCCFAICNDDPFCCNSSWDALCASAAAVGCYGCGASGSGSCYVANGTPACNDAQCCTEVCAADPFCCESAWDGLCADQAPDLCGPLPPINDTCGFATLISEGTWPFTTIAASTDGSSTPTCGQLHADTWYKIVAPYTGTMTVSTCGLASGNTKIALYKPTPQGLPGFVCSAGPFGGSPITFVACNDDACGTQSSVSAAVEAGVTYTIRLGTLLNLFGVPSAFSGQFNVNFSIANDLCSSPLDIPEGLIPFSTIGAGTDGVAHTTCGFCCGDTQIHHDVWFRHTAECDGTLTVSTCGSADFDTKIAVYKNSAQIGWVCSIGGPPQSLLGCNDDTSGCPGATSTVSVQVEAGTSYRIRVGGYNGASGTGTLSVSCKPLSVCEGDLDGNGAVDGGDLGTLLGAWGTASAVADLDGNGIVDGADLGILLGAWGSC